MSRRKHGDRPAELAQAREVKIMMTEQGTSGLKEYSGFVTEAYLTSLQWPAAYAVYNRLRRSMPEIVMMRQAFSTWARNVKLNVDLPENPTDDDTRYKEFVESVFEEMEGGFGLFMDTLINHVPFMGWGWWEIVPGRRDMEWTPPDDDTWQSESDDGLIGLRRLAWRDNSSFYSWEFDKKKRLLGMWQQDYPNPKVMLPLENSLHMTFGDPNNPEGLTPLEAVYRLERIRYGLEVVQGIGYEHAAGHLAVKKTEDGQLSTEDKNNVKDAARAILTAREGNYAMWPFGLDGTVIDVPFSAAPSILEAIKYYGVTALSCYTMQWIALSATTGAGSYAAMNDSSSMGVFTFNSMLDGFAAQLDAQVGKRLYNWNKSAFPNMTARPKLTLTHIEKETALAEMSAFVSAMRDVLPLGDDDIKEIRERVPFLSNSAPDPEEADQPEEMTPEQQAQKTIDIFDSASAIYRAKKG